MTKRTLSMILCAALLLGVIAGCTAQAEDEEPTLSETWTSPEPAAASEPTVTPEPTATLSPTPEPTATPEPYESPIDFAALQEINPDIYAWLKIEDSKIDYPIVQHPAEDEYYLVHNSDGGPDLNGAIFTQVTYNEKDFTDPVTILYGHNMASGAMFGTLRQSYTDQEFFDGHKAITIYTPDEELDYQVFACIPYSDEHILYEHDFTDEGVFKRFFEAAMNTRDLMCRFDEDNMPEFGDRVIILSTCISGTPMRFLVMASLKSEPENRSES